MSLTVVLCSHPADPSRRPGPRRPGPRRPGRAAPDAPPRTRRPGRAAPDARRLHCCVIQAYNGHLATVTLLLDHGADGETKDRHGDTALQVALIGDAERRERFQGTPPESDVVALLRTPSRKPSRDSRNSNGVLPHAGRPSAPMSPGAEGN